MWIEDEDHVLAMLKSVGIGGFDELFADVPKAVRAPLPLPPGRSDLDVETALAARFARNVPFHERPYFLGGGLPPHHIPAETRFMSTRGEFLTAYTPYQPEVAQGLLQALFEFQTLSARLLGLDVANTGVYDATSGAGEACLMALRAAPGRTILVPESLPRARHRVIQNYIEGAGGLVRTVPSDKRTGQIDLAALKAACTDDVAALQLEQPNFFGVLEPMDGVQDALKGKPALLTVAVHDPVSLGAVKPPGDFGAAVATAEGQSLAIPPTYGGPGLGLFAVREDLVRKMPGRIVGQTVDRDGRTAYCLTLQTREQHIRRAKATSNICTNQSLLAVLFTTTLAILGENGLSELARTNAARAHAVAARLAKLGHVTAPAFEAPFFNEFLVRTTADLATTVSRARALGVEPGLRTHVPGGEGLLVCVTELQPQWALDALVQAFEEVTP